MASVPLQSSADGVAELGYIDPSPGVSETWCMPFTESEWVPAALLGLGLLVGLLSIGFFLDLGARARRLLHLARGISCLALVVIGILSIDGILDPTLFVVLAIYFGFYDCARVLAMAAPASAQEAATAVEVAPGQRIESTHGRDRSEM